MDLHLGRKAVSVDLEKQSVIDDQGTAYTFERLLLATGGRPRHLQFGGESVIYFRTLDDYRRLRTLAGEGKTFAIIGGGFIGSEIAAALAMQGCKVVLLFPDEGIGSRVFPPDLGRFLVGYFGEHGVDVRPGESVVGLRESGAQVVLDTRSGVQVTVDAVVAGIGIVPNTDLAGAAGLLVVVGPAPLSA